MLQDGNTDLVCYSIWCSSREYLYPPQGKLDHVYRLVSLDQYVRRYISQESVNSQLICQSKVGQYIDENESCLQDINQH